MEAGKPSMIHDRWLSFPSAPTADVTRDLKAGLRYFSKRSPGSWICMSLSTNLSPSFMASSVSGYYWVTKLMATSGLRTFVLTKSGHSRKRKKYELLVAIESRLGKGS